MKEKTTFPERAASWNIYEVNIRQYTPEGTINAFKEHLPRLKELGADILWIMPVQPIGVKNRKGPLGSYYSIQNYSTINPEFGTLEDFKSLVRKVHELDMTIILGLGTQSYCMGSSMDNFKSGILRQRFTWQYHL